MTEIYEMFGVGWEKGHFCGSSTFCIDKDDNVFLVQEECGEIDWEETKKYEGMLTIYKDIWEKPIPIVDAHNSNSMYEKSYRFVERNQKEIIDTVRNGVEEDRGVYCIKIFTPRALNIKEMN